jgi:sortase A
VPTAPEPGTVEQPQQIDAFSQGWFDDDEAWPQIALWGLALTIISLLAYQVSKRTRHDSIGFAVGIAPFLFSLYFFFQNVNRLLPPGL